MSIDFFACLQALSEVIDYINPSLIHLLVWCLSLRALEEQKP